MAHSKLVPFALTAVLAFAACGPADPPPEPAARAGGLASSNGLTTNGLANNGLASNGLASNGLANNGLSTLGLLGALGSSSFATWFGEDPALAESVIRYVVRCALPAGTGLSWKNKLTGKVYTWSGELGLAPAWATSKKAPALLEQRAVTACLAALAN
jgi:hypothetical protein